MISLSLVTRSFDKLPDWLEDSRLIPRVGQLFATGTTVPVEERCGLILAEGFFSHYKIKLFNADAAAHFVESEREDVVFFYGAATVFAGFLEDALDWIPSPVFDHLEFNASLKKWYFFLGGLIYTQNSMQLSGKNQLIDWVVDLCCHFIETDRISQLLEFPKLFLFSIIHSIGFHFIASLNKKIIILLRTLYLSFVSLHSSDLIQATATAIGLVCFAEGQATFDFSPSESPYLFLSFLPFYSTHLGSASLMPDLFRPLWRCCSKKRKCVCLLRGEETNLELQVRFIRMDGSDYTCNTPVFVSTSDLGGIEICSDRYQLDCSLDEIKRTHKIWVRAKHPLFSLDSIDNGYSDAKLTREELLRLEQIDDSNFRALLLMKKRCVTKIEKEQMELVEEWYNSVLSIVCKIDLVCQQNNRFIITMWIRI